MIDQTIPDRRYDTTQCGSCSNIYTPIVVSTLGNQVLLKMKCPCCGNNDYTKTTYITEDGKVPLTISN